jgi:O-antigen biosynthesis protein
MIAKIRDMSVDLKKTLLQRDFSPHSPHTIIPSLISAGSTVLDVGCNRGYLGEELLAKNCVVDGVDINLKALRLAKKFYRKTYQCDLSQNTPKITNKYDYVVFADILEHLPKPELLLLRSLSWLKPNGRIIISLPNVARLEIRLKLLLGRFDYDLGILSHDHLRFYTKTGALKMIKNCGLQIDKIIPTGFGHRFPILPTLTAFQFVFVCRIDS